MEHVLIKSWLLADGFAHSEVELGGNLFNCGLVELGQVDMVGSLHGSSEHGWVSVDVAKMVVIRKLAVLLDVSRGLAHFFKCSFDIASFLGADHTDLGLIIAPNNNLLIVIYEQGFALVAEKLRSTGLKGFVLLKPDTLLELVSPE